MKYTRFDFYALDNAIAYGVRESVALDDIPPTWEVFVKLSNGNRVVVAHSGTQEQAERALRETMNKIQVSKALIVTLDNTYLDLLKIVRVYVDGEAKANVVIAEDTTGEGHLTFKGTRTDCREALIGLSETISTLHNKGRVAQADDEDDDDAASECAF